jgi:hypothetical protein
VPQILKLCLFGYLALFEVSSKHVDMTGHCTMRKTNGLHVIRIIWTQIIYNCSQTFFTNSPSEDDSECLVNFSLATKLAHTIFPSSKLFLKIMCVAQSVPLPGFLFYYLSISLEN